MIYKRKKINWTVSIKNISLKATFKRLKGQVTDWEKIFANESMDNGLISKTYKQLVQLNIFFIIIFF